MAVATQAIPRLEDAARRRNDYVAYADLMLDTKTIKPSIREWTLAVIEKRIRNECEAASTPQPPVTKFSTRTPLIEDDRCIAGAIGQAFGLISERVPLR
ncbi:hypothetical protein INS49_011909 [Diaporthe citri]|uniref:uncharacterized protein n=1 Tax=Diaporthe citri TaxID=83186 RepID=UPI001C80BC39|nr:uncharacterized protein INS49_011909 [Diaporthe citri]KAG6360842.1 hypothetical protein INS49_011909 [Diaporthe citri]